MRNKETLFIVLFLLFIFFLFYGCAAKKTAIKREEQKEVRTETNTIKRDSTKKEYFVDTTIYGNQVISIDKIEFYPTVMPSDSSKQKVKSITKVFVGKSEKKAGKTEVKELEVTAEETAIKADSSASSVEQITETKEQARPKTWLWIWLIVIVFVVFLYKQTKR